MYAGFVSAGASVPTAPPSSSSSSGKGPGRGGLTTTVQGSVQRPSDDELAERIDKVVSFLANRPQYLETMRNKEASNPKFAFLRGGNAPGAAYFAWKLGDVAASKTAASTSTAAAVETPPPASDGQLGRSQQTELMSVLGAVNSSKSSVEVPGQGDVAPQMLVASRTAHTLPTRCPQHARKWIIAHVQQAEHVAAMMLAQCKIAPAFAAKLNVLYVINDVLFSTKGQPQVQRSCANICWRLLTNRAATTTQ